jgi:hypothetical protein
MDDASNVFKRKEHVSLEELLFRNRQPRFTIFICAQDPYSIPVKIRRNLDNLLRCNYTTPSFLIYLFWLEIISVEDIIVILPDLFLIVPNCSIPNWIFICGNYSL